MQLNMTTDYALRAVSYLATEQKRSSIAKISEAMEIPRSYLPSIMKKLSEAELVSVQRGVTGGWVLAKPAQNITVLDIISVMENTIKLNRCLEDDQDCNREASANCPLRHHYSVIQDKLESAFADITLDMLVEEGMMQEA